MKVKIQLERSDDGGCVMRGQGLECYSSVGVWSSRSEHLSSDGSQSVIGPLRVNRSPIESSQLVCGPHTVNG